MDSLLPPSSLAHPIAIGSVCVYIPLVSGWVAIVLLGIVEGITEFLPISSTAHLLIAEH